MFQRLTAIFINTNGEVTIHCLQLLLTVAWQQGCQMISSEDRQICD